MNEFRQSKTETLVLPKQYVELQEDEMMYLDGGGIPNWMAEGIIHSAFALMGLGGAIHATRTFIAMHGKYLAKKHLTKNLKDLGLAFGAAFIGTFFEFVEIWTDPVKHFVEWLDGVDGNKNGWIL